jgi:hypothetical protein
MRGPELPCNGAHFCVSATPKEQESLSYSCLTSPVNDQPQVSGTPFRGSDMLARLMSSRSFVGAPSPVSVAGHRTPASGRGKTRARVSCSGLSPGILNVGFPPFLPPLSSPPLSLPIDLRALVNAFICLLSVGTPTYLFLPLPMSLSLCPHPLRPLLKLTRIEIHPRRLASKDATSSTTTSTIPRSEPAPGSRTKRHNRPRSPPRPLPRRRVRASPGRFGPSNG